LVIEYPEGADVIVVIDSNSSSYDAIVVGARVAGASTALLLARAGLRVLVLERGRYGTDTLSTHALMRGAVLQLARWNVLPALQAAATPLIRRTRFQYGDEAVLVDIAPRGGVPGLMAPRRYLLDRVLVDAARAAGAEIVYGASVVDLLKGPSGRVNGVRVRAPGGPPADLFAPLVIGADGLRSVVARLAHAPVTRQGHRAGAVVFGYWPSEVEDELQWWWGPGIAAGVIPSNGGESCVFAAAPAAQFDELFKESLSTGYFRVLSMCARPMAERLHGFESVPRLRGFPGEPGVMRQAAGDGWALVGDAGYFKDPITAHGITDALRDAELLAAAVLDGRERAWRHYQDTRDELSTALFDITDQIAGFDWSFARLGQLHRQLSDQMQREVQAISDSPLERTPA
jgi:2-polyprenyl-6-methoxyphenol hydroxylase-like FAD-dependent oxidoreductase